MTDTRLGMGTFNAKICVPTIIK